MSNEKKIPDRLMYGEENIKESDVRYYDVLDEPFELYGFYEPRKEGGFKRLPDEIGTTVNKGVTRLYKNTAGGRVRFSTDSEYVILRAELPQLCRFGHMPLSASAGFDLYVDTPENGSSHYYGSLRGSTEMTDGFTTILRFEDRRMRHLTINFPLYNDVSRVWIGLQEDASVGKGMAYRNQLPVVFYGSSITQGGCASRPGNCYQNMISRRLGMHYLNLGFSGSGKAEDRIVDYMAGLSMSAFVSDYDHNAPSVDYLRATHCKMYQKIREKNPDLPYIMISRPDFAGRHYRSSLARRDVIIDTFRYAREQGDQNVWFIDGESFFAGEWEDCCTVDGVHPNDLGFSKMAEGIGNTLSKLILK